MMRGRRRTERITRWAVLAMLATLYLRAPGAPRPLQAVKVITATAITGEHVPHPVDVARIPRLFGVIECRDGDLRTEKPK